MEKKMYKKKAQNSAAARHENESKKKIKNGVRQINRRLCAP